MTFKIMRALFARVIVQDAAAIGLNEPIAAIDSQIPSLSLHHFAR
jgi:ABC-type Mn2+/Zn2+ transport system ATPase subunit